MYSIVEHAIASAIESLNLGELPMLANAVISNPAGLDGKVYCNGLPVELARLFAPAMVERGYGRILSVASLAGQMPATGGDTLYGPIKSFLIKASQGLHLELRGTGVHVTALCPGYTLTEFHDVNGTRDEVSTAYPAWMWQTADHVARVGYAACEANRPKVTPGVMNNVLAGLAKHLPDRVALNMVGGHAKRLKRI
jgi:short-subunit dehydrogenase